MSTTLEIIVEGRDLASTILTNVGGALRTFGQSAERVGMDLLPLSTAAAAVSGSALKLAADYENSMNVLQATTSASAAEMAALDAKAIALGADITLPATSAKDAADAMLELSKAGLSVNETMAASKGVLQMSAAGQLSNAEAAKIAANALNSFGLEGSQATMVADLLAAAANASSADVRGMADSLQMASAVASMAGQSIQDTTTAIALMANAGIAGSDAGTSLKQMLLTLQAPSKEAATLMRQLGINIYDAHGNMLPLPDIIKQFSEALGEGATRTVIFGGATKEMAKEADKAKDRLPKLEYSMTQAATAAKMSAEQMRALEQAWLKSHGTLDGFTASLDRKQMTLFNAVNAYDTAKGSIAAFEEAQSSVSTQTVKVTQDFRNNALATIFGSDAVRAANIVLMAGTDSWNQMSTAVTRGGAAADLAAAQNRGLKGALDGLRSAVETALLTAAKPLLDILTPLVRQVAELTNAFVAAHPQLATAGIAFGAVFAAAGPVVLVIGMVATALGALAAPIGIVILAVAALTAAWVTNFGNIQGIVGQVVAWIQTTFQQVSTFLQAHGTEITGWLRTAWTQIQTTISAVTNLVQAVVTTVFGAIQGFLQAHGAEIQATLKLAWDTIGQVVNFAVQVVNNIVVPVFTAIGNFIRAHGDDIQAIMSGAWSIIQGIITAVCGIIQGIIKTFLAVAKGDWSGAWEAIKNIAAAIWKGIEGLIKGALQAIAAVINLILGIIGTDIRSVWTALQTFLSKTWNDISTTATRVWTAIKTSVLTPIQALETALSQAWTRISTSITTAWNGIKQAVTDIVGSIVGAITGAFSGLNIHIPMPHFSVSWNDIGFGVRLPNVGVSWYAKGGDFLTNGPMLIGVGENGSERVRITPTDRSRGGLSREDGGGTVVHIYNPVVREEQDLRRIVDAVNEALSKQTQTNQRMGYAW